MQKMTWKEICDNEDLRGRWVAIDGCLFDEKTGSAVSAEVVDADDDLAELCARIRESKWRNCSIMLAEKDSDVLKACIRRTAN
jgi:hypothetical protein